MENIITEAAPLLVALLLALCMFAGGWLGFRMGRRRPTDPEAKFATRFVDGSMALLGLLLGFTFFASLSKHEDRRQMILADSNSIRAFYTSASLLKDPEKTQLQQLVRRYTELEIDLMRSAPTSQAIAKAYDKSDELQDEMARLSSRAIDRGIPGPVPLGTTLNNLMSSRAALFAAFRDRLTWHVILLLFTAAIISMILMARQHGVNERWERTVVVCYVVLVCLAVYVILDLNQPEKGLIRIDARPLDRVAAEISR